MTVKASFLITIAMLPVTWSAADARGGRFLSSLLARGAGAAVRGGASSSGVTYTKSYTPDVLTVAQLATCIRKATKLDADSERVEARRATFRETQAKIDTSNTSLASQRERLDSRSKSAVNLFNASIDRHNELVQTAKSEQVSFNASVDAHNGDVDAYNAECAKKYYADDLTEAQKIAAAN